MQLQDLSVQSNAGSSPVLTTKLKVMKIYNGDVYDIGQTVNGVSKFIYFNDKWHYYREDMTREYEYPQEDLTKLIHNDKINGEDEVTFLGNIFSYIE